MKNLKFTFFAIILMAMASPQSVFAFDFSAVAPTGQTLYYNIVNGNAEVTCPQSYSWGSYTKPTGVLTIPSTVSYNGTTYSVTSIGEYAFYYCSGLTSVTIPNSVTSIGDRVFYNCSGLTSVTIPNSVTSIGNMVFFYCSGLTSVTIPNSVTSIGHYAFYNCSGLTSVTIPNSVTSIGDEAFSGCSGLTSVTFNATNCTYMGSYNFPVFYGCTNLSTLTIGDNVTNIPNNAFCGCSGLTSVTIPNSVTSIGESAFSDCSGLTSVTIGSSVTSIGNSAFRNCSGLTSVTIPNSVTSIGNSAFSGCSGLTSVTIPNSVTSIGKSAFSYCSSLTSIIIPESVSKIESSTFNGCSSLPSVTVPSSVDTIGNNAFRGCTSLDTVIMLSENPPIIFSNTFEDVRTNVPIFVPCGSSDAYNEAAYWNVFTRIQEADNCNSVLTLAVNNSNLGCVRGAGMYRPGSQVEILAVPAAGKLFIRWNDANTNNPRTITINSDTAFTAIFDTVNFTQHDTIWLHDTIIIHDTIYISQEGIDGVAGSIVKVYSSRGQIVVEGSDGNEVTLYDAVGRQLAVRRDEYGEMRFDVQASGVYFIRVGSQPVKRIVAIR